jgi:hypothetical protein
MNKLLLGMFVGLGVMGNSMAAVDIIYCPKSFYGVNEQRCSCPSGSVIIGLLGEKTGGSQEVVGYCHVNWYGDDSNIPVVFDNVKNPTSVVCNDGGTLNKDHYGSATFETPTHIICAKVCNQ